MAESVFALLRHDAQFCSQVATVEQAAALKGVSRDKLLGCEATWQEGRTDLVGPRSPATWAGSPEQAREAERVQAYSESLRKRLWGE